MRRARYGSLGSLSVRVNHARPAPESEPATTRTAGPSSGGGCSLIQSREPLTTADEPSAVRTTTGSGHSVDSIPDMVRPGRTTAIGTLAACDRTRGKGDQRPAHRPRSRYAHAAAAAADPRRRGRRAAPRNRSVSLGPGTSLRE